MLETSGIITTFQTVGCQIIESVCFCFKKGKNLIKPFKSLENPKGKMGLYSSNILTLETQLLSEFLPCLFAQDRLILGQYRRFFYCPCFHVPLHRVRYEGSRKTFISFDGEESNHGRKALMSPHKVFVAIRVF